MEIIIGRESSANGCMGRRLCITAPNNQVFYLGHEGSVPQTVSRQHCKISIETDGSYTLINLKPANITYVNGQEIMKKRVRPQDFIELGSDRYRLNLQELTDTIRAILPMTPVSLAPLKEIWESYQKEKIEIQIRRSRSAVIQSVTSILSMLSIVCGIIPTIPGVVRTFLIIIALCLGIYFFFIRYHNAGKDALEAKEFEDRFKQNYQCPCGCGRFMGYVEYKQLVISQKQCPISQRPYTTDQEIK